jgi:hypothetical protein
VIDGVVVLDEAGRSDFGAVKTAITLRGRDRRWRLLAAFCRRRSKESTAGAYL